MPVLYDIAILGANPAGCAAAAALARSKHNVLLLDAPSDGQLQSPLSDWVPKTFFEQKPLSRTFARQAGAVDFKRVTYHNVTLEKQADYTSRAAAGYFLPAGKLDPAIRKLAQTSGAVLRSTKTAPAIRLNEDSVELLGTRRYEAKLLMITQGRPADVLAELARPLRAAPASPMTIVALDIPFKKTKAKSIDGALHVMELPERSEMGMFFLAGDHLHVRVLSTSAASGNRAEELSGMISGLQEQDILPPDLPLGKAKGAVWHPPAGAALELDTHEAKRCLVAGTAGGFVSSATGHALLPTVESALLAADVCSQALKSKTPQDRLMEFRLDWQKALADYLRPPNTSLPMLLPLLFVNQRMVTKFTRALLFGEEV